MDIKSTPETLTAHSSVDDIVAKLKQLSTENPDLQLFVSALDPQHGDREQFTIARCGVDGLLTVALASLKALEDYMVEFVRHNPEEVIRAGIAAAASKSASEILTRAFGTTITLKGDTSFEVKEDDEIGPTAGRA